MVQVTVSEGVLEGAVEENQYLGGNIYSFKGIPYAAPPVGDLRFKAPQPAKPWQGVRSAKEFGPISIQFNALIPEETVSGSEDCLYLNVYSPELAPTRPLPVMVWIHGGAFKWGSGNNDMYGSEFLIKHGVVLVTLNYRLEALGFLCLHTEDIPGNAAMKDQVAALRWVKKNIRKFGGDPDNVTIFGESAGAASVGFQAISPMSKGLFKRVIVQSGAPTCYWAEIQQPRDTALCLARQLGCYSEDDKELYDFFKNVPAEKLVNLELPLTPDFGICTLYFSVVNEKQFGDKERFFYGVPNRVVPHDLHEGIELMVGYTRDESVMAFPWGAYNRIAADINKYSDFCVPRPMKNAHPVATNIEISKKIKKYFIGNGPVTNESYDNVARYANLELFMFETLHFARLCSLKNTTYLYKFCCLTERNTMARLLQVGEALGDRKVVSHCDDLMYLFPCQITNAPWKKGSETETLVHKVCTLWTDFAKYGNPTPDAKLGVKWEPLTLENKAFLELNNSKFSMETAPEGEDMAFFESIYREYLPHAVI